MKFKRGISLALALALIAGIGDPLDIRAAAADTGSSDALARSVLIRAKRPTALMPTTPATHTGAIPSRLRRCTSCIPLV